MASSAILRRFFEEAGDFGIRYGYTVPLREGFTTVAALTFATDQSTKEYTNCIGTHGLLLDFAARCFHNQIRRRVNKRHVRDYRILTDRQKQCLELSIEGKSAVDIGDIVGIKPRTVVFHIENAKAKYGVRTITQAAIAFRLDKEGR
jgi:DNA-binding CsgD family transcriptional regulator